VTGGASLLAREFRGIGEVWKPRHLKPLCSVAGRIVLRRLPSCPPAA
jgi:hypothetical protein